MEDLLLNMGVSFVLTALATAVKNPAKAATLRAAMLKIYASIGAIWGAEPDFVKVAKGKK